jgi:hypothetical protein
VRSFDRQGNVLTESIDGEENKAGVLDTGAKIRATVDRMSRERDVRIGPALEMETLGAVQGKDVACWSGSQEGIAESRGEVLRLDSIVSHRRDIDIIDK